VHVPVRRRRRRTGADDQPQERATTTLARDDDDRVIVVPDRDRPAVATPSGERPRRVEDGADMVRQFAWSGLAGSVLVALGAFASGWVSLASGIGTLPVLGTIRSNPGYTLIGKLVVIVGVALLVQAWLRLGHVVRTREVRDGARLNRLALWWGLPMAFAPVLFSRDVYSYIAQSRLLPHGIDPYVYGTGVFDTYFTDGADWIWKTSPAPYGPLWMGLSSGVYRLTGAAAIPSLLLFRLLAVAGVLLIALYLPRLARACGADEAKAVWLGLLNPLIFLHFVSAAHNDALMVGLLVAGMTYAMEKRPLVGLVLVSLAGAVKAPALLGLPFVGIAWAGAGSTFWRRVRMWVASGLVALGVFVLLDLMTGLSFGWLSSLGTPGQVRTWLSPTTALGMTTGNLLDAVGLGYRVDGAVDAWRDIGAVVTVLILLYLVLTGHRRSPARGLGLSLLTLVLLGPVVQTWYLLWGLVVLAGAGLSRNGTRAAVLVSVGFTVFAVANAGSTVPTNIFLADGPVTLLSVAVVAALLLGSRYTRNVLLEDALPSALAVPVQPPSVERVEPVPPVEQAQPSAQTSGRSVSGP
jgi:alpha-1,6-mannosyltransferase